MKNKIITAVGKKYKKPLEFGNLTTNGFMQLQPIMYREMIPFESIEGKYQLWSRTNPFVAPCFGITNYHLHKFFVRYKDIFPGWDDFYNKSYHVPSMGNAGYIEHAPSLLMAEIWNLLDGLNDFYEDETEGIFYEVTSGDKYDFVFSRSGAGKYYKLGKRGVKVFSLFLALGYEFSFVYEDTKNYSLLPLFAFGKIYVDYYWPKNYLNYTSVTKIKKAFTYDIVNTLSSTAKGIYLDALHSILTDCLDVCYRGDSFYSAWDTPVGPSNDKLPVTYFLDPTNDAGKVGIVANGIDPDLNSIYPSDGLPENGTPFAGSYHSGYAALTQWTVVMLRKLTEYVERFNLAGNAAVQRFFARFGITLGDNHTARDLGFEEVVVKVGDVESNSNGSVTIGGDQFTSVVGDLAGKGVAANASSISFNNDSHFGMFMVLLSVVPESKLFNCLDRVVLHDTPDSFYTPENDNVGPDAIGVANVFNTLDGSKNRLSLDRVFGFWPHGWENVINRNILNGAFRFKSFGSEQLSAYHLYRDLDPYYSHATFTHGLAFLQANDANQFNRVFYDMNFDQNFIVRFKCLFNSNSFKKPLNMPFEFETPGKPISVDGTGTSTN